MTQTSERDKICARFHTGKDGVFYRIDEQVSEWLCFEAYIRLSVSMSASES